MEEKVAYEAICLVDYIKRLKQKLFNFDEFLVEEDGKEVDISLTGKKVSLSGTLSIEDAGNLIPMIKENLIKKINEVELELENL